MQAASYQDHPKEVFLQLMLFVDERPSSRQHIQTIQNYLQSLKTDYRFELQVIEMVKQPHLVEHFKLVATPALVKIYPEPKQTLAGSNLIGQLKKFWPRWQLALDREKAKCSSKSDSSKTNSLSELTTVGYSEELICLSDEIFRLKQEKQELLEQLQFKDQVLAMLAHDIRSPLTAASIAVETLEITQKRPETERTRSLQKQLYKQAKSQFQIMDRMITDLLQASKSMSAKLQVQPRQFYLQSLCEEILIQFEERFEKKSQIVKKDIPGDLPKVYGDPELIRQVIVNLLENGMKYTPIGGTISLSILHRTSQKIQVSVCDSGPGIPEENIDRIFEGHFRLKRDEASEGYGLGLYLCRKIIRAHYGQIWVDTPSPGGSCFHFTLPVYR